MDLTTVLIIAVIVIILAIFIFIPETRVILKGFTRLFVKDMASTPEGAEAIYGEKINQAEEAYAKADDYLRTQSGKLSMAKRSLENNKQKLEKISQECESLVKAGNLKMAEIKVEEREEVLSDIARDKELVSAYQKAMTAAQEMHDACETSLRKLKKEKKEVVENMKVKKQLKEVYDGMDELKAEDSVDKLLSSIREKNKDLDAYVEGARNVHESKLSTKLQRAEKEAKKIQGNDYLESLKKKYNK